MKIKYFLFIIILLTSLKSIGQVTKKEQLNYKKNPVWIVMMNDTLTNYFEANNAFNSYWKVRPIPIEEEDIIGHSEMKKEARSNWLQQQFISKQERREQESELYAFQYRKFKNWLRAMKPYVQDDGSILTPSQRIAIWKQQQSKYEK